MVTWKGKQYRDWAEARSAMVAEPEPVAATVAIMEPEPLLTPTPKPVRRRSLVDTYRPKCLAELVGQNEAVVELRALSDDPYPCALLLSGDTGTGKTSAAWALAGELGCNVDSDPPEFGGIYSIPSGEHTPAALKELWPQLWTMPFESANGWKVLIVNEVERLSASVESLWLDKLEDLPPSTVIVFTTNNLLSLPSRFRDRCTEIAFQSDAGKLSAAASALARAVWRAETGDDIPADVLERALSKAIQSGQISFRRVVQSLVPHLARKGR